MSKKAVLIDGHNFLFRGFYGVPVVVKRPDGTPINAVYGFFALVRSVLKKINPEYLVVVFDSETSADKKKEENPEYKANRVAQDDNIYVQLEFIKKCLDLMGISWLEDELNEADDVIGTYSEKFNKKGICVHVCSNDHDFMQLVGGFVSVVRGARGEWNLYDQALVVEKYGVYPEQYLDYLALVGDLSDNIKGVKGVGKKRAADLLSEYKNINAIYGFLDDLAPGIRKSLDGKKKEILKRKEFFKIDKNLKTSVRFNPERHRVSKELIPEKMGEFLTQHWDGISQI